MKWIAMSRAATWTVAAESTPVSGAAPFAFGDVYAQHAGFVFRVLRGMGVSEAQVADAVQDVFVVVHRRLAQFDGRHAIRTWLFEIAYRVACDYRRKLQRARSHEPLHERLHDPAPGPGERAERGDQLRLLNELLDQLDDDKRVVLVLAEIEELSAPEIASLTGVPLNTVYTRLRRARIALNQALAARKIRP
jgi:RNA polymerase sigma-70 factor (ECF subfamily)